MDSNQLDRLAKLVGSGQSRRRILKTLTGGALASVAAAVGFGPADASKLRSAGNSCASNSDCASGLCVQEGRTRKICHCQSTGDCPTGDACQAASCQAGACTIVPASCDDNNLCTIDSCDPVLGCVHTPINCDDNNPCTADTCDPQTGCAHTPVQDGTSCDDGNACTQTDTCQAGVCVAGDPVVCGNGEECVNGGCFEITSNGSNCNGGCSSGYGSVDGSGQFLCGAPTSTPCSSNADCPADQACTHCCGAGYCIAVC